MRKIKRWLRGRLYESTELSFGDYDLSFRGQELIGLYYKGVKLETESFNLCLENSIHSLDSTESRGQISFEASVRMEKIA